MELTATAYTIADAPVGAGVGEPSPWPFQVRLSAAAEAGCTGIGLFEGDYAAIIESGQTDDDLLTALEAHSMRLDEVEFLFDWAHDDVLAEPTQRMHSNLLHMAEVFRPHHISLGEVCNPDELPPVARVARHFAAVCDMVAPLGVKAVAEILPWSGIADVAAAARVVELADRPNGGQESRTAIPSPTPPAVGYRRVRASATSSACWKS